MDSRKNAASYGNSYSVALIVKLMGSGSSAPLPFLDIFGEQEGLFTLDRQIYGNPAEMRGESGFAVLVLLPEFKSRFSTSRAAIILSKDCLCVQPGIGQSGKPMVCRGKLATPA